MKRRLFFPSLTRRPRYRLTSRGTYYRDYSEYRTEIREDCQQRCYYCDSYEHEVGGSEHMQVDHFRPKGLPEFSHLISDPNNLVYACGGCNRLKLDDWPARGLEGAVNGSAGYIDRFDQSIGDCHQYLRVEDNGALSPIQVPAAYMITQLALNRPVRKRLRELRLKRAALLSRLDTMIAQLRDRLESRGEELTEDWRTAVEIHLVQMRALRNHLADIYEPAERRSTT